MSLAELVGLSLLPSIFFISSNYAPPLIRRLLIFIGLGTILFFFNYAISVLAVTWTPLLSYFYQASVIILSLFILETFIELLLGALRGLASNGRLGR